MGKLFSDNQKVTCTLILVNFIFLSLFFLNRNTFIIRKGSEPYKKFMAPIFQNSPLFDSLEVSALWDEAPQ